MINNELAGFEPGGGATESQEFSKADVGSLFVTACTSIPEAGQQK